MARRYRRKRKTYTREHIGVLYLLGADFSVGGSPIGKLNINVYNFGRRRRGTAGNTRKTLNRIAAAFQKKFKGKLEGIKGAEVVKRFKNYEFKRIAKKEKIGKRWRISMTHFESVNKKFVTMGHYSAAIWYKGKVMKFRTLKKGGTFK